MAAKKNDDELKDQKDKIAEGARAVGKAADSLLRKPVRVPLDVDAAWGKEWENTAAGVDALDAEFDKEDIMNQLRSKYEDGNVEVRVMQVGPGGRLVDVSDKVNPKDLRPEHIEGFQIDDGAAMPLSRNPQTREAALRLLGEILPGLRLSVQPRSTTSTSVAKMEAALAESDKILEHWKK